MLIDRSHFHFIPRRESGALSLMLALQYFGGGLVGVFIPILFWNSGFSLANILLFYLLNSLCFILLTFIFLPLIERLSDKMMMFLSVPPLVLCFLGLEYVTVLPALVYVLPLLFAANALLFNVGYNLAFSRSSDDGHIGRAIGTRDALMSLVQFSAPLAGGFLITAMGFHATFSAVAGILLLSTLPLFAFPHRHLASDGKRMAVVQYLKSQPLRSFTASSVGHAMELATGGIVWPLFLYLVMGNIRDLGGVVSFGLFAAAIVTVGTGYLADAGKRRMILAWSAVIVALVYAVRALTLNPTFVVASSVAGSAAYAALLVAWTSEFYKITRAVKDPGAFILSEQVLFHTARALFLCVLIVLSLVLPVGVFFPVCFALTALIVLLFLFANKFHVSALQKEEV